MTYTRFNSCWRVNSYISSSLKFPLFCCHCSSSKSHLQSHSYILDFNAFSFPPLQYPFWACIAPSYIKDIPPYSFNVLHHQSFKLPMPYHERTPVIRYSTIWASNVTKPQPISSRFYRLMISVWPYTIKSLNCSYTNWECIYVHSYISM